MNKWRLILRSLVHYRRTHAGVVAGAAVGAAVLTGALIVGDSVKHTLRAQALARIGRADLAMATNDRFFIDSLADRLASAVENGTPAPVLLVRGVAATTSGDRTTREVSVLGVDERFLAMAPESPSVEPPQDGEVLINQRLAGRLGVSAGETVVLRVEKPSALPRESVLGTVDDVVQALRVTVARVVDDAAFGRFSLQADQIPPANAFVSLAWLQEQLGQDGRSNLLLADVPGEMPPVEAYNAAMGSTFSLTDAQLVFENVDEENEAELSSERIFIDPVIEDAVGRAGEQLTGVLTYFVNAIEHEDRSTPYSMVSAIGPLHIGMTVALAPAALEDLTEDEIIINEWLADDLECDVGDEIRLRYFVLDDKDHLTETTATFSVSDIVPMTGLAADASLMPPFPGVADAENSRDWQPGIPIDLGLIRDRDEDYWDAHRGTPKAFVSLAAGKAMWGNRYGSLTAVRFPAPDIDDVRAAVRNGLEPESLGFFFRDIRTPALAASKATTDFGGLFLGLSFFLIFAALLLTSLLFVFNIEQRKKEIGTLLAVGYRPTTIVRLLIGEGAMLALIGSAIGAAVAVVYTRLILTALASVWSEAVASASIHMHVAATTLLIGISSSLIAATGAMWLTLRRGVRREPIAMLSGIATGDESGAPAVRGRIAVGVGLATIVAAVAMALLIDTDSRSAAPAFFGAGSLLLIGGIALSRVWLLRLRRATSGLQTSFSRLAMRNAARRIGRSLATIGLLACGVFLVVAIAVNRLDAEQDADDRSAGTGGFAFIGESSLPVLHDLNERRGRDAFGLGESNLEGVSFVSMRVREGDDASCLNLNLAQQPRLVGVDPAVLAERDAFRFAKSIDDAGDDPGWDLLDREVGTDVVPAIGDDASITWAMHRSIGDTLEYTDEAGRTFQVMIVGTIANSILQGNLLIAEDRFKARFPSRHGYRMFLVDAPPSGRDELSQRLERALADVGLELTPATQRLADFNAVQNTYLAIFQILGGLGLLLGSVGLGIVVLRNVLERRGELALLRAVGYNVRAIRRLVRNEHVIILLLGLLCGVIAAVLAVLPALRSATADFPLGFTAIVLVVLLANGLFWVWFATRVAVSGPLVSALRED